MRLLLLLLLCLIVHTCYAGKHLITDTSRVEVRSFDNHALQEYKKQTAFQYDRSQEPVKSLWDRFWEWVWWNIEEVMRTKKGRTTVWIILIVLGVAVITFFVIKVMGMNKNSLFARGNKGSLLYSTSIEDINLYNFEEAIREAIEKRNLRLATRLLYLQSLKHLSDKGYIDWQINKTNTDYITEVSGKPWGKLFKKLTYNFEYIWYGEMNVQSEYFQSLQQQFQQFNNQLR